MLLQAGYASPQKHACKAIVRTGYFLKWLARMAERASLCSACTRSQAASVPETGMGGWVKLAEV